MSNQIPPPPEPPELDDNDPRTKLRDNLMSVLAGLPSFFEFDSTFAGINATDLHSLNTLLGTSIEAQVVKALNQQRKVWDPDDEWPGYAFERQSQRFPDVLLTRRLSGGAPEIALGIELKGWFLLAKEGMPSFRFETTPGACSDHDLLVCLPWHLDNVLAGQPVAADPYVVSAKWAAEYRNHWWEFIRDTKSDAGIKSPAAATPYPSSIDNIHDVPNYDGGGNFGRLARSPVLMGDWVREAHKTEVLGIPIGDWFSFLRQHTDVGDREEVSEKLRTEMKKKVKKLSDSDGQLIANMVNMIGDIIAKD